LRVSVVGPPELFADRTVELLRGMGIDARRTGRRVDGSEGVPKRIERIKRGLSTDVFFHMCGDRALSRLQHWLARLGIPTLILWIGSDIVFHASQASSEIVDEAWHWCRATWLRDELAEAGIEAKVVLMSPPRIPTLVPAMPARFTVMAYMFDDRHDLYGYEFVVELARRRPDIRFLLLAATSPDGLPDNVTALGWIEDVNSVMSETTLYIRPTSHDGLSYLVLEALAQGRYVLWTHPFPGAEVADSVDAAEARIDQLYRLHEEGRLLPNNVGREAILEMFEPAALQDEVLQSLTAVANKSWRHPPGRIRGSFLHAVLKILRRALRTDQAWASVER
jgi:hypothetical protein